MARNLAMATRDKQTPAITAVFYLSGVIDSDGCISISKMASGKQNTKNPRYVLTINVVNTSEDLMRWLVETFGGRYKRRSRASVNWKPIFDWQFNNGKAIHLLELIEPHLIVKKRQAGVGLELIRGWETNHGGPAARTAPEEIERRERLYQTMKVLNQRGLCSCND